MRHPWDHVASLPLHTRGLWTFNTEGTETYGEISRLINMKIHGNNMIHDGYSISFFCFCQMLSIFVDPGSPDHTFDTVGFLQSCDRHSWGNSNPLGAWGAHRAPRWSGGASLEAQQHPTLLGSAWRHHSGGTCRFSVDKSLDVSCFVVLTYVYFQ